MNVQIVDLKSANAAKQFSQSLMETGFAVLKNHTVDNDLIFDTYREWENFFNTEDKHQYKFNQASQDGYFPYLSENAKDQKVPDLKEFFHYYHWGQFPQSMSRNTAMLRDELTSLAHTLLEWLESQTPAEIAKDFSMPLTEMIQDSKRTLLRILNYPALEGVDYEPGAIRAAAHEDINLITVLPASTAPGLQVLDKKGNWHDVSCDPGMIAVNAADMLQLCSKNHYISTTHRVVNPRGDFVKKARLSMPLFLHARDEVELAPGFTATQYREQRLREIGLL